MKIFLILICQEIELSNLAPIEPERTRVIRKLFPFQVKLMIWKGTKLAQQLYNVTHTEYIIIDTELDTEFISRLIENTSIRDMAETYTGMSDNGILWDTVRWEKQSGMRNKY